MRDKATGRAKGMALVAVDPARVEEAIAQMDGKDFQGRPLKVARSTVADKPRQPREPREPREAKPAEAPQAPSSPSP
ncbi:hypothetical protein HYH03_008539 [Edaphochlamys debaryana]|uniref:RNA-binding protein n=1 Tax=Edaphochlamys debaryana TaxID=47281 RepID=A0A835Y9D1_9CHLO|nr:hypothetical protein HYH03_008539 [Edaphochlamys debaryana]|eukprot:KAG2493414.1 hypothetical protein HYH03_008539 [Edaphochlamys debaryana]